MCGQERPLVCGLTTMHLLKLMSGWAGDVVKDAAGSGGVWSFQGYPCGLKKRGVLMCGHFSGSFCLPKAQKQKIHTVH